MTELSKYIGLRVFLCLLAFAVCCSCFGRKKFAGHSVRIGFDNSPPYMLIRPDGSPDGLAVELINEAARRQQISLRWIQAAKSSRRLEKLPFPPEDLLARRLIDVWPVAGITPERVAHFYIGKPWLQNNFFLVSRKTSPIVNPAQAENKRIAHYSGPLATAMSHKLLGKSQLIPIKGIDDLISLVCTGNADAAFLEGRTLEEVLMERPDPCFRIKLRASAVANTVSYAGIEARPEFAPVVDALSDEISAMAADGSFAGAADRWSSFSAIGTRSLIALQQAHDRNALSRYELWTLLAACFALGAITMLALRSRKIAERARFVQASGADVLRQLVQANDRASLAARAAGVGIWDYDIVSNRFVCDNQMLRLNGIARQQFGGTYEAWQAVVHADDRQRGHEEVQLAIRGVKDFDTEFRVVWPDGSVHSIRALAIVQRDSLSKALHLIGTNWDITAQKQAADELRESNRELEVATARARELAAQADAANTAKGEFLANMSHEIRTPMNGVIGMTSLALQTTLDPEQREYISIARSSAESLLGILNDILDFSKIEAGKLTLNPFPFDPRDELEQLFKTIAFRADEKGVELNYFVSPDIPERLVGDALRLRQVLLNLLGNAIKFTAVGEVTLTVEPVSLAAEKCALRFSIRDTGIGMSEDQLCIIFQPFTQADGSTTRNYGGTGLGLAISLRLVEALGGQLSVQSKPGMGSTFSFELTLDCADRLGAEPLLPMGSKLENMRVLVVDGNQTNLRILCQYLRAWQVAVDAVDCPIQALEVMQKAWQIGDPYTLILLGARMPGMDGFTLAEKIGANASFSAARILMLSSAELTAGAARCRKAGISRYLVKPVAPRDLRAAIEGMSGIEVPEWPAASEPRPGLSSGRPLRILLAEDNPVNQKLSIRLLEKQGHFVRLASNGMEAQEAHGRDSFDVILMDVQMPVMDGLQATAAIREREQRTRKHVPIIALTAHALEGDRARFLAAGIDAYLSKPFRTDDLLAILSGVQLELDRTQAVDASKNALTPAFVSPA